MKGDSIARQQTTVNTNDWTIHKLEAIKFQLPKPFVQSIMDSNMYVSNS